jgi:hypothetical protein
VTGAVELNIQAHDYKSMEKKKKMKFSIINANQETEKQTEFDILHAVFPIFFNFDSKRAGGEDREIFLSQPYTDEIGFLNKTMVFENMIVCSLSDLKKLVEEIEKRKVVENI